MQNTSHNEQLKIGIYQHYKGNLYKILYVGMHTETEELMVVYHALHDEKKIWLRPLTMFLETVDYNNAIVPRFSFKHD